MNQYSEWTIDRRTGRAAHTSGLSVVIQGNEVVDIEALPSSVSTSRLPSLLREALSAFRAVPAAPSNPVTRPLPVKTGPAKPTLSLKKKVVTES